MYTSNDAQALIEDIHLNFQDTPYPGEKNIVPKFISIFDDYYDTYLAFKDIKHWQDIDVDFVLSNKDTLHFLTAEAFHFYLPAFMIAIIRDPIKVDVAVDSTFFLLNPNECKKSLFKERIKYFNNDQAKTVKHFMQFFRDVHAGIEPIIDDINKTINSYWNKF